VTPEILRPKKIGIISKLVGRSEPFSCCPGKKAGAEAKKGREKPNWIPLLGFRKETRGQKVYRAETAEARLGKRGTTPFFGPAKRGTFLPGQETHLPYELSLFTEPDGNKSFQKPRFPFHVDWR